MDSIIILESCQTYQLGPKLNNLHGFTLSSDPLQRHNFEKQLIK